LTYEDFTAHLEDREYFGQKLGLDRIRTLLQRLGNPHEQFASIHIAGTNGKGSTANMIAAVLRESSLSVGLYTSPHLQDFCERIRVGDRMISQEMVLRLTRHIREVEDEPLTFFEIATAIAFLHFAEEKVDIAVIETGLGGRLDATNIVIPLLSIITTIGRDHMAHLGETLGEIAFEKAGIIKKNVPVVTGPLAPEAMAVIREIASVKNSPLVTFRPDLLPPDFLVPLRGHHQQQNAAVAITGIELLREMRYPISPEAIRQGLEGIEWPGRLETVSENPWILLDGAHNLDAMRAVRIFLEENQGRRNLKILFGAMADKEIRAILGELQPLPAQWFFTAPRLKRAATPQELARIAGALEIEGTLVSGVDRALDQIVPSLQKDDLLLVTGSLFVVGEAKKWFSAR